MWENLFYQTGPFTLSGKDCSSSFKPDRDACLDTDRGEWNSPKSFPKTSICWSYIPPTYFLWNEIGQMCHQFMCHDILLLHSHARSVKYRTSLRESQFLANLHSGYQNRVVFGSDPRTKPLREVNKSPLWTFLLKLVRFSSLGIDFFGTFGTRRWPFTTQSLDGKQGGTSSGWSHVISAKPNVNKLKKWIQI